MAQREVEPAHRREEDPRKQRAEGIPYEPAVQVLAGVAGEVQMVQMTGGVCFSGIGF